MQVIIVEDFSFPATQHLFSFPHNIYLQCICSLPNTIKSLKRKHKNSTKYMYQQTCTWKITELLAVHVSMVTYIKNYQWYMCSLGTKYFYVFVQKPGTDEVTCTCIVFRNIFIYNNKPHLFMYIKVNDYKIYFADCRKPINFSSNHFF